MQAVGIKLFAAQVLCRVCYRVLEYIVAVVKVSYSNQEGHSV